MCKWCERGVQAGVQGGGGVEVVCRGVQGDRAGGWVCKLGDGPCKEVGAAGWACKGPAGV